MGEVRVAVGEGGAGARGRRRLAAALVVGALVLSVPMGALADDRDDAANKQRDSAARVDQLSSDLEGIDSNLADIYVQLDTLKAKIPVAQAELDAATAQYEAATRQHQVALDQLDSAVAERARLKGEIEQAQEAQARATDAIAGLAREMYRGDTTSPLVLAMTSQSTQEIGDRASAAESLARTQNRTMDEARASQVVERNKVERQEAVTTRIAALEERAATAEQEADTAKATSEAKVAELQELKSETDAKAAEWSSRKADAQEQLESSQAQLDAATEELAKIDAANRSANTVFSGGSSGTSSTTGGGMFSPPLRTGLNITSPFGWRIHPLLGVNMLHAGTDFAASCGTPQYPIAPGVISKLSSGTSGGNIVYINHGMINGHSWITAHMHLQGFMVSVGQQVGLNSVVGYTGSTGGSTGCHLHLSMWRDGALVDPMTYL